MDERIRRVERRALAGDLEAERLWRRLCGRMGLYFKDHQPDEILTEWEEVQKDYDDLWWHGNTGRKCGLWGGGGIDRFWDVDFRKVLFKAHHKWGHRWGGQNSKRKTLRTHRDGSRRNYKIERSCNDGAVEAHSGVKAERARRRKKRFGGKQHRKREWFWDPKTERVRVRWRITEPRLDE